MVNVREKCGDFSLASVCLAEAVTGLATEARVLGRRPEEGIVGEVVAAIGEPRVELGLGKDGGHALNIGLEDVVTRVPWDRPG